MQSATLRVIAPTESRLSARGKVPAMGTRLALGLKPTRLQNAAGIRSEPPVSVPSPATAMPSATLTAAPELEPPAIRSGAQGVSGVP